MILVGYSWVDVLFGIMYVSLGGLVIAILYKRLLKRLNKDAVDREEYCVLYALEEEPAQGELVFYFTSEKPRSYSLDILDENMSQVVNVESKTATEGGNIVRFDSTTLSNGIYFYCLRTENQKTMKKMTVKNG